MRFVLSAAAWMLVLYGAYYFPYAPDGMGGRVLEAYLRFLAKAGAATIGVFESGVRVEGTLIEGRMPLSIVKTCSSLDAQALYVAAIIAFPARLSLKAAGILCGVCALTTLNVLRIAGLYFIGVNAAGSFDVVHEELMPLVLVALAVLCFAVWARLSTRGQPLAGTGNV